MTSGKKKTIAVDKKFFETIFEQERTKLQLRLGIGNLSQTNFTKMIKGFKMKKIKPLKIQSKLKMGKKRNDFFPI